MSVISTSTGSRQPDIGSMMLPACTRSSTRNDASDERLAAIAGEFRLEGRQQDRQKRAQTQEPPARARATAGQRNPKSEQRRGGERNGDHQEIPFQQHRPDTRRRLV